MARGARVPRAALPGAPRRGSVRARRTLGAHRRANVRDMLSAGWVDEVRALLADGYREARAMKSVGYRQIAEALDRERRRRRRMLFDAIVRATRIFARRQRTWLRDEPVLWLTPERALTFSGWP